MTAQINLFHAHFHIQRLLLPFSRMTIITLLAMLIVPAIMVLNNLEIKQITHQLVTLKKEHDHSEREWNKISTLLSRRASTPEVSKQALKLETILAHRTEIMHLMTENGFDNNRGYSDYLIALARQHTHSLWLTSIRIINNGSALSIEGKVNKSAILPHYLKRLSNENILAGTPLKTLKLIRDVPDPSKKSPLSFMISSTLGTQ